jgi:hypothetical protein
MPFSGRATAVAFGRQVDENTALASPKFEIPYGSGSGAPEKQTQELPWIADSQDVIGYFANYVRNPIGFGNLAPLPRSLVTLVEAALGTRTTTGAADPFQHDLTPADDLPWLTWMWRQPGNNYWISPHVKLNSVEIPFSAGMPLGINVTGAGKGGSAPSRSGTKWPAATVVEDPQPFFTYIGAEVLIDPTSTPAATQVRNVPGGTIRFIRDLEEIQTDGLGNQYINPTTRRFEFDFNDVVVENNDFINSFITGSTTGTNPSVLIAYGSLSLSFGLDDGTAKTSRIFKIVSPKVQYLLGALPEGSADGSTARLTMTGRAVKPSSGAIVTATVKNQETGANH